MTADGTRAAKIIHDSCLPAAPVLPIIKNEKLSAFSIYVQL
jgi:hypothetical protein